MRKFPAVILSLLICTLFMYASYVFASEYAYAQDIKIYVNGNEIDLESSAVISNSRILAPIRPVAQACGLDVSWNSEKREATLSCPETSVTLKIDSEKMKVYNAIIDKMDTVNLDTAPAIIDSSTYITLRAAMEALDIPVEWNGSTRSIHLTSKYIDEAENTPQEPPESTTDIQEEPPVNQNNAENNTETTTENSSSSKNDTENTEKENTASEITPEFTFTGFREMENHKIILHAPHGLYGRVKTNLPITMIRCRITGTKMDYTLFFNKEDNLRNYNVYTYFDKLMCFSDAGLGEHTFEIYSAVNNGEAQLVYSYNYTVVSSDFESSEVKKEDETAPSAPEPDNSEQETNDNNQITDIENEKNDRDTDKSEETENTDIPEQENSDKTTVSKEADSNDVVISYYGFSKMTDDSIVSGAPHGLYGTVVSNCPITFVRCRITGTDMDYSVQLSQEDNITSYNIFTFFDSLICFSDATPGKHRFQIFVGAANSAPTLIFNYSYTVKKSGSGNTQSSNNNDTEEPKSDDDINDNTETEDNESDIPEEKENTDKDNDNAIPKESEVCLPLEGDIQVTSPYGFRAYNKWEFHKGVDIISQSLNIIAVADGEVVDCATGRNSGVGNYVALQHEGGWVSLYYHLASYDVEIGDTVKMGEKFATMGNTGGNYGIHLHFMACDNWYGSLWATQNNHHKPPHEYVPQLLDSAKYYTPCFEDKNTDKIIIAYFEFPSELQEGKAYSISNSGPNIISENPIESITLTVTDNSGNEIMSETTENPPYTIYGEYTYTPLGVDFDMLCEFDKLPKGDMRISVSAVTANGRERTVYIKDFTVK